MGDTKPRPRISEALYAKADEVREERDLANVGAALERMVAEGGFEV